MPDLQDELRGWLSSRLPAYMIPAFFVELETFPMTDNGKINRKALPNPIQKIHTAAPRLNTEMEHTVLSVWAQVLGHDRIGTHHNFFHVGGDSARLIRVQKELERVTGRSISPAKLFEHYTIKTLAAYLEGTGETESTADTLPSRRAHEGEDIAIVSMACRLPGGIDTPEAFWELLRRGGDVTSEVPKDRWDSQAIYSADAGVRGTSYCQRGGFLAGIDNFDAAFFGISPREARAMDPGQRLMLETCWEGFERAGFDECY